MNKMLILMLMFTAHVFAEVKVITVNDGIKTGHKVEYGAGNIILFPKEDSDFKQRIGRQLVKAVVQQETNSAKFLRNAFYKGKFPAIASDTGEGLFTKDFHTGWGKKSAFFLAMSHIKVKKFEDAARIIKKGKTQIPGENDSEDNSLLRIAEAFLKNSQKPGSLTLAEFNKAEVPNSALGKMYFYKLQGLLLENESKDSLAVLSYYKSIFLGEQSEEKKIVTGLIQKIYIKQQDPRKLPDLSSL